MRQWARRGKKPGKSFLEIWEEEWAGIAEHDDGDIRQILFPEWDELPPPPPAPERSQHPTAHLALRPHLAPPTDFGQEPSMVVYTDGSFTPEREGQHEHNHAVDRLAADGADGRVLSRANLAAGARD